MTTTSNILKASEADKQRALDLLNKVKDKPLMVKKIEAINTLFEQITVKEPNKA